MPLGKGILAMLSAVQDRVEVSGRAPTWKVTAGSYDAALDYAREAFGDPAVVAHERGGRWWARVTLTVTTDPAVAAAAPPPSEERDGEIVFLASLDEIFERQEAARVQRLSIPQQRATRDVEPA